MHADYLAQWLAQPVNLQNFVAVHASQLTHPIVSAKWRAPKMRARFDLKKVTTTTDPRSGPDEKRLADWIGREYVTFMHKIMPAVADSARRAPELWYAKDAEDTTSRLINADTAIVVPYPVWWWYSLRIDRAVRHAQKKQHRSRRRKDKAARDEARLHDKEVRRRLLHDLQDWLRRSLDGNK